MTQKTVFIVGLILVVIVAIGSSWVPTALAQDGGDPFVQADPSTFNDDTAGTTEDSKSSSGGPDASSSSSGPDASSSSSAPEGGPPGTGGVLEIPPDLFAGIGKGGGPNGGSGDGPEGGAGDSAGDDDAAEGPVGQPDEYGVIAPGNGTSGPIFDPKLEKEINQSEAELDDDQKAKDAGNQPSSSSFSTSTSLKISLLAVVATSFASFFPLVN